MGEDEEKGRKRRRKRGGRGEEKEEEDDDGDERPRAGEVLSRSCHCEKSRVLTASPEGYTRSLNGDKFGRPFPRL